MSKELTKDKSIVINGIERYSIDYEEVEESETIYNAYSPWRRFFARSFDLAIYHMIWRVLFIQVFSINVFLWKPLSTTVVDILMGIIFILFLEPLMLCKLGTTPGKKILGLEVRSENGKKLSYGKAFDRSWGVMKSGMGFILPIYVLIRFYKSYKILDEKKKLPWDKNIQYKLLDKKWYRGLGIVIGYVLIFLILFASILFAAFPPNRGNITVSEYAENYNYLVNHYDRSGNYYLDSDGAWVKKAEKSNDGRIRVVFGQSNLPSIDYTTEGKYLTSVTFKLEVDSDDPMIMHPLERIFFGTLAFVLADDLIKPWSFQTNEALGIVNKELFETYHVNVGQTTISNTVESKGFTGTDNGYLLYKKENAEEGYYYIRVKVER